MLEINYKKGNFIRAYNDFSLVGNRFYLTDEEFYLYCTLFINKMVDESIITNIDMINQLLKIPFSKTKQRNIKKTKELLASLINKNIFIPHNNFDVDGLKNNTLLEFTINDKELSGNIDEEKVFKNFAKVPYLKFTDFEYIKDAYIYYIVARWEKGAKYPINQWSKMLNLCEKQATTIINDAVDRGIIFKNIGDYIGNENGGQKHQESNTYFTSLIPESKKTAQTKKVDAENNHVDGDLFDDADAKTVQIEIIQQMEAIEDGHQWNVPGNVKLTVDDFVAYLTTEDKGLIAKAKKRIDNISKKKEGKWVMDKLIEEAKESIAIEKQTLKLAKEAEINNVAKDMIKETSDIVLTVDGELIAYKDYNESMKVEKVFYYITVVYAEGFGVEIKSQNNPNNIDKYRKNDNGKWKEEYELFEFPNESCDDTEEFQSSYVKKVV